MSRVDDLVEQAESEGSFTCHAYRPYIRKDDHVHVNGFSTRVLSFPSITLVAQDPSCPFYSTYNLNVLSCDHPGFCRNLSDSSYFKTMSCDKAALYRVRND